MEQRGVTPAEAIPGRPTPSPPGIPYMGKYPLSTQMSCAAYGENNNVDRNPHFVGSLLVGQPALCQNQTIHGGDLPGCLPHIMDWDISVWRGKRIKLTNNKRGREPRSLDNQQPTVKSSWARGASDENTEKVLTSKHLCSSGLKCRWILNLSIEKDFPGIKTIEAIIWEKLITLFTCKF